MKIAYLDGWMDGCPRNDFKKLICFWLLFILRPRGHSWALLFGSRLGDFSGSPETTRSIRSNGGVGGRRERESPHCRENKYLQRTISFEFTHNHIVEEMHSHDFHFKCGRYIYLSTFGSNPCHQARRLVFVYLYSILFQSVAAAALLLPVSLR